MTDSVILGSPLLIVLYAVALAVCIIGIIWKKTSFITLVFSACLVVCASAYAVISGAALSEVIVVVLVFLAVNLFSTGWGKL